MRYLYPKLLDAVNQPVYTSQMNYGHFDDAAKEYVITTPRTPVKWINYLGTLDFGGFVDSTGGGILCKGDPSLNRIVKYIGQMPASDFKGQTLYARFRPTQGQGSREPWRIFSPFYVPSLDPWEAWECRVGLGYTRFVTRFHGIDFDIRIFVPRKGDREIRDIRVRNSTDHKLELDLVPVVEYTHFDALKQLTNADWVPQTMQSRAIRDGRGPYRSGPVRVHEARRRPRISSRRALRPRASRRTASASSARTSTAPGRQPLSLDEPRSSGTTRPSVAIISAP